MESDCIVQREIIRYHSLRCTVERSRSSLRNCGCGEGDSSAGSRKTSMRRETICFSCFGFPFLFSFIISFPFRFCVLFPCTQSRSSRLSYACVDSIMMTVDSQRTCHENKHSRNNRKEGERLEETHELRTDT